MADEQTEDGRETHSSLDPSRDAVDLVRETSFLGGRGGGLQTFESGEVAKLLRLLCTVTCLSAGGETSVVMCGGFVSLIVIVRSWSSETEVKSYFIKSLV